VAVDAPPNANTNLRLTRKDSGTGFSSDLDLQAGGPGSNRLSYFGRAANT
jgi:hypothetical protein